MKVWFRVFVLLSLVCLAAGLYQADYLKVPEIGSAAELIGSFVFLFAGFLVSAMCWKGMLGASNYDVYGGSCIAGMGLSIFGKYVPGKIWTIVGRAAYIAQETQYSLTQLSVVSLKTQFLDLWTGLILGTIGLCAVGGLEVWGWTAIVLSLLLTVLIFSRALHSIVTGAGRYILRKEVNIPTVDIKATLAVAPWSALTWGLWTLSFYLLASSLLRGGVPWSIGLAFPLAATLGILAVIAPGGLGVREGVLTGYLTLAGIPLPDAVTVAVASRLWFLIGEVSMFIVGVAANRLETGVTERGR